MPAVSHFHLPYRPAADYWRNSGGTLPDTINDTTESVHRNGRVGVNAAAPTSSLHVEGSISGAIRSITANTTLTDSDQVVRTQAASLTLTLPSPVGLRGRVYTVITPGRACTVTCATLLKIEGLTGALVSSLALTGAAGQRRYTWQSDSVVWVLVQAS
jgi:hypothetical protein